MLLVLSYPTQTIQSLKDRLSIYYAEVHNLTFAHRVDSKSPIVKYLRSHSSGGYSRIPRETNFFNWKLRLLP